MSRSKLKIQVYNVLHFHNLLKRGYDEFQIMAIVEPSMEKRYQDMWGVEFPTVFENLTLSNNIGYDTCMLVLRNPKRYKAAVYCYGAWSNHDMAEEMKRWAKSQGQ